jgi:hypothetical protein
MNAASQPKTAASSNSATIGTTLIVLVASELLYLYTLLPAALAVAIATTVGLLAIGWRRLEVREYYLLVVSLLLFAIAWFLEHPVLAYSLEALERSAYLSAFVFLMALLREGALTSRSVLDVGTFLTRQPASRRFVALFAGGHFFAVLINLGALSLLAPIVQRGVRANLKPDEPLDDISEVRERRQLTAVLRGFSWFLLWAPTAVTQAVMPTLMSGIDAARLATTGMGLAVVMLAVSWLEDALRWRGFRKRLQAEGRLPLPTAARLPLKASRNLGLVCVALFGLTIAFTLEFGVSIVSGVMLTSPIVVFVWVLVQQSGTAAMRLSGARRRLTDVSFVSLPGYYREAVFLAFAGYIGTMAAKLIPTAEIAAAIELSQQPGWLVLWCLTLLVLVFGQVGLSPITMAVFLGSVVAELDALPVDITLAALAIAAGTAVCTTGAPFASGALMLARATGHTSATLTWRWNGTYTLIVLGVLCLVYVFLTS